MLHGFEMHERIGAFPTSQVVNPPNPAETR